MTEKRVKWSVRGIMALFLVFGEIGLPQGAIALPQYLEVAKQTFALKTGGAVASAGCVLCHAGGPPKLNPYGLSVKAALTEAHTKTLTGAILHTLDTQDADGDGFPNADEVSADALPGDPASHPAGTPPTVSKPGSAKTSPTTGEVNPFDLKAALFARHAQHPVLIHFPIALFISSVLFDVLALWKKNRTLAIVGECNLALAALTALPAVATGLLAWQWQYGGAALTGNLRLHLIFALIFSALVWTLWRFRSQHKGRGQEVVGTLYLVLALLALAIVGLTGHLGGILSGVVTAGG